jgi:ElaB/YqjD/DUF883 family membrane-anchored ribosome-binding protein
MADTKDWVKDRIEAGADKAKQFTEQAGHAAQSTKDAAGSLAASAAGKAKEVVGSVAEAAGEVKDKAKEWTASAVQGASRAAESVKETATQAYDKSSEAFKEAGKELTDFVRRYPIPSLCIGLGIGFLLGRAARNAL